MMPIHSLKFQNRVAMPFVQCRSIWFWLIVSAVCQPGMSLNAQQDSLIDKLLSSSKTISTHQLSIQGPYPFRNIKAFIKQNDNDAISKPPNLTELLYSMRYIFYPTTYLPKHLVRYIGRLGIQFQSSWLFRDSFYKPVSYSPFLISLIGRWDFSQIPYITPSVGWGITRTNLLNNPSLASSRLFQPVMDPNMPDDSNGNVQLEDYLYTFIFQLLLSFDILDQNFSLKMEHEYSINDIGIFFEYQKYVSVQRFSWSHPVDKGWTAGVFFLF